MWYPVVALSHRPRGAARRYGTVRDGSVESLCECESPVRTRVGMRIECIPCSLLQAHVPLPTGADIPSGHATPPCTPLSDATQVGLYLDPACARAAGACSAEDSGSWNHKNPDLPKTRYESRAELSDAADGRIDGAGRGKTVA